MKLENTNDDTDITKYETRSLEEIQEMLISEMTYVIPDYQSENMKVLEEISQQNWEYRQEILNNLKSINQNTAYLFDILSLIKESNDKQEEIISIVSELLTLPTFQDKATVKSTYAKIMERIANLVGDIENIDKLYKFSFIVLKLIDKLD
jgi:hypothetical protein